MEIATEEQLAEAILDTSEPLAIVGGGTRGIGVQGAPLSVAGITGVRLYAPGALTLVARAGTPLSEIDALLAEQGQRLAFEPIDCRKVLGTNGDPTIGGVIASNASGPRRVTSVGACRDSLLGVRFVDGAGQVIKNGGRVMKNVTGYDLVKLMAGSFGTLGVLSEVSLKVLPVAEATATLIINGLDLASAVREMAKALGSPYEVSGAAFGAYQDEPAVYLRLEGFEASVAYRAQALRTLLSADTQVESNPDINHTLWADIRDVAPLAAYPYVAKVALKPSDVPAFTSKLNEFTPCDLFCDWGGGLIWVGATSMQLEQVSAASLTEHLRKPGTRSVTVIKSPDPLVPMFDTPPAPVATLIRGIRAKFDPRGILNQGLMD